MTVRDCAYIDGAKVRAAGLAVSALALTLTIAPGVSAQTAPPAPATPGPVGRWVGTGLQVDWLGHPLEIPRIEVVFDDHGDASIDYPTLGCSGVLTRIAAADNLVEYRETLTTGLDKCASGATVALRSAGDRWVYDWAMQTDWLKPEPLPGLGLPSQPGTGPDGDSVRSGVLTADPAHPANFAPRDPAANAEARAARVENDMVPPVLVAGEPVPPATLADRMAALHVPGVSITVIHKGRIDWARGYGVTRPGGPPVTPDTLFQAASISKPVTAMTVLRLAEQKRLDLDIDVGAYLGDWSLQRDADAAGRPITLRELLTHTAGATVDGFAGYDAAAPLPTLNQMLAGQPPANSPQVRIDTAPGALWRYSGGGYVAVRKVLEDVSGMPFAEVARQQVLAPSGMANSRFAQPLPAADMALAAMPYGADGQPLKEGPHTYPELAPDGLWTTASDLARLAIGVQGAFNGGSSGPLAPATAHEMLQPGLAGWGLGWAVGGAAEHPYFWHSGSNAGYKSMLFAYADGEGVAIMTNGDAGEKLAADIARTIAYEYGWPDFRPVEIAPVGLAAAQLDTLTGQYRIGRYGVMTVTRQGDRLFAQTPGGPSFRLYPKSASTWFAIDPDGFNPAPDIQIAFQGADLIMRKDGYDTAAPRLDAPAAARIAEALAARIAAKAPDPASEPTLRRYIAELQSGKIDYDALSPGAAYITRLIQHYYASDISALGALEKLDFAGVGPNGADQFLATFAHGTAKAQILSAEDGKIELVMVLSPSVS
jgi:CubicO group peptidase (beta-lactamase class C family)